MPFSATLTCVLADTPSHPSALRAESFTNLGKQAWLFKRALCSVTDRCMSWGNMFKAPGGELIVVHMWSETGCMISSLCWLSETRKACLSGSVHRSVPDIIPPLHMRESEREPGPVGWKVTSSPTPQKPPLDDWLYRSVRQAATFPHRSDFLRATQREGCWLYAAVSAWRERVCLCKWQISSTGLTFL